jgi:hypothetical protein
MSTDRDIDVDFVVRRTRPIRGNSVLMPLELVLVNRFGQLGIPKCTLQCFPR